MDTEQAYRHGRSGVILAIRERLKPRHKAKIDSNRVSVIGVFGKPPGPYSLVIRIRRPWNRSLYIRWTTGFEPVVGVDVKWETYGGGIGDNERAYRRMAARARKHARTVGT